MSTTQHATESGATIAAKISPPISVSIATIYGIQISELLLWATLVYTLLMIGHKILMIRRTLRADKRNTLALSEDE